MNLARLPIAFALLLSLSAAHANPTWGQWRHWGAGADGRYHNPVLPADYSDIDITQVGKHYYAITSTFQYSPGMAVLQSEDLVNWRTVGHAVPDLTQIGPELNWDKMDRYGRGIWAGAIRHHAGKFWIFFGTPEEGYFMTSARSAAGPWAPLTRVLADAGWDDCAPFWDDDGQGYLVGTHFKGDYKITLWKLSADNRSLVPGSERVIYQSKGSEASKLYKFNGWYYHFFSEVHADGRVMMMQRARHIGGPYLEKRQLAHAQREAQEPNQGGFVIGPDKRWYFFTHHGNGDWAGRAASLLPVTWIDGWPIIGKPGADGIGTMVWEGALPFKGQALSFPQGSDDFSAASLAPQWEWNYQPRADKWSLTQRPGYLRLFAFAGLDGDNLLKVGNMLTQRAVRADGSGFLVKLDVGGMANGQHAGLAHYSAVKEEGGTASIGVVQEGEARYIATSVDGVIERGAHVEGGSVWLRSDWGLDGLCRFSFSTDGAHFQALGAPYQMRWGAYRGGRIGLFSYNNSGTAGFVDIDRADYTIGPR